MPPRRIQEIVAAKRAISPETALRIGVALGTGGRFWPAMQRAHDLRKTEIAMGDKIRAEVQGERIWIRYRKTHHICDAPRWRWET